jgi:hypothetical protein
MITDPNRCIACGARLVTEREAARCQTCQDARCWPQPGALDPDTARPALPVLAVPRHRVGAVCRDGTWVREDVAP